MITQATFPIPHTNGLRPRSFLAARKALMQRNMVIKGADAEDYRKIYKKDVVSKNDQDKAKFKTFL